MRDEKQTDPQPMTIFTEYFSEPLPQDGEQPELPLQPIISDHFTTTTLSNRMTLKEFRRDKGLSNDKSVRNVFVEWDNIPIENGLIDVILKNKVSVGFQISD